MRTVFAFLVSPLVIALLAPMAIEGSLMHYPPSFLVGTVPVVYLFTAVVALPLYLALPSTHKARLSSLLIAAFTSGFGSFAILSLASKGTHAQVGTTVLVENGWYTLAGALNLLQQCLFMGLAATLAGALFWLIAVFRSARVA
jgi:hypothetical protein